MAVAGKQKDPDPVVVFLLAEAQTVEGGRKSPPESAGMAAVVVEVAEAVVERKRSCLRLAQHYLLQRHHCQARPRGKLYQCGPLPYIQRTSRGP